MGEPQASTTSVAPAESASYTRLTLADHAVIVHLIDSGLTLSKIAQQLGRSVSTIFEVKETYRSTTDLAKRKLAAASLRMADNVIENGQPRDHVAALKGLDVLKPDTSEVKLAIGLSLPGMPNLSVSGTVDALPSPTQDSDK